LETQKNRPETNALDVASFFAQYATTQLERKRPVEAEQPARACLILRDKFIPDDWRTFNSRSLVGGSLLALKDYTNAEPMLLTGYEGLKLREETIPADARLRLPESIQRLVQLYEAMGQSDKAASWKTKLAEFDKSAKQ